MGRMQKSGEKKKPDPLDRWLELDLTEAARRGEITPAWDVEETLRRLEEQLDAGQSVVITGDPGVGKTALVSSSTSTRFATGWTRRCSPRGGGTSSAT